MDWRSLRIDGVGRIERLAAVFVVEPVSPDLPMGFRIKILERADGSFVGYPEIALRGEGGHPDLTSGHGATIEEALSSTFRQLLLTMQGKEPIGDETIYWDPRF